MMTTPLPTFTAFDGPTRLAAGSLDIAALAVKRAGEAGAAGPLLIFDDRTGGVVDVDVDLRGTDADALARLPRPSADFAPDSAPDSAPDDATDNAAGNAPSTPPPRGRGRPKLGVTAREVTLLPRHWDWLAAQPGGASVALRKLVEEAKRRDAPLATERAARERAYRFMSAIAGDLPGFEDATRALFAGDMDAFAQRMAGWPGDVRDHALRLASPHAT